MKTREQAEARALELFPTPKEFEGGYNNVIRRCEQKAFLQCWDEMQQEYAKQSKQDEVNDNPHLGYKTALVPDGISNYQPQEKVDEFEKRNPSLIDFRNWLTENDNEHRSASLMVAEFIYQNSKPCNLT